MEIHPSPGLNYFLGDNGAGKTSVLEAIYTLIRGRSFKTRFVSPIIRAGVNGSSYVYADWISNLGSHHRIAFERNRHKTALLLDGNSVSRLSAVSSLIPLQLFTPQSFLIFSNGAIGRRRFLDWGLFHVEQAFITSLEKFNKFLVQRNHALRRGDIRVVNAYNKGFIESALAMDKIRNEYFNSFAPIFYNLAERFSLFSDLKVHYWRGWKGEIELEEALYERLDTDLHRGYTSIGPHHFDLRFLSGKQSIEKILSNGEQKLVIFFLKIAQIQHLNDKQTLASVFLVDDLYSELSKKFREIALYTLKNIYSQIFVTGTEYNFFPLKGGDENMFHVKQGAVLKRKNVGQGIISV